MKEAAVKGSTELLAFKTIFKKSITIIIITVTYFLIFRWNYSFTSLKRERESKTS